MPGDLPSIRQTLATLPSLQQVGSALRRDHHHQFSPAGVHIGSIGASLTSSEACQPKYWPAEALLARQRLRPVRSSRVKPGDALRLLSALCFTC
ncbi:hypothetical protein Acr_00g0057010 [Actinidia rufa]|uniref:Uncharacterized protein n=1 Tax=Actinidia rufa TaxID=165716 RepID=A0A7J0DME7_9ERIC|nr:hypothetical protein Acr_00g0057010 [Actinidia rufa]